MLLFLRMDVHYWLLRAIGHSYLDVPPGALHLSGFFTMSILKLPVRYSAWAIQIAAPVLAVTLIADIVLGLLGKASPQLPLMLLGPSVKSLLGLLVLIATLKYWPDLFNRLFTEAMTNGERLLHMVN